MNFNSLNYFSFILILFSFILIFSLCFFIPIFSNSSDISLDNLNLDFGDISNSNFLWPTPNYKTITSKFGYRTAPTIGASTYHGGIDIAAPTRF